MALLAGCASASREPSTIIVRNGTGHVLSLLQVHEVTDSQLESRRFGQFTGVPPYTNQRIPRRPSPPPLPETATVTWQAAGGPKLQQELKLQAAIRKTDTHGGVLIIEVMPDNSARVFIVPKP